MYQDYVAKAKQKLHEAQLRRKRLKVNKNEKCSCQDEIKEPKKESKEKPVEQKEGKLDDILAKTEDRVKPEEEKPRLGIPRNYSEQNLKSQTTESCPKKCCSKSNPNLLDYSDECSMELIQLDIARTFPHLCIFQPGGPYFDVLHELLAAYVCYRPDIGYVQVSFFYIFLRKLAVGNNLQSMQVYSCMKPRNCIVWIAYVIVQF